MTACDAFLQLIKTTCHFIDKMQVLFNFLGIALKQFVTILYFLKATTRRDLISRPIAPISTVAGVDDITRPRRQGSILLFYSNQTVFTVQENQRENIFFSPTLPTYFSLDCK
jgi:hypothetical protein